MRMFLILICLHQFFNLGASNFEKWNHNTFNVTGNQLKNASSHSENTGMDYPEDWQGAQWIWQTENGPANCWMSFRKEININNLPAEAIANIAVDSRFWLWINGEMVVFEGGTNRGPGQAGVWDREKNITPTNTWYQDIDIKPYLKPGENTVALLVWYWGRETHKGTYIDSKKGGLLFHCNLGEQALVSDSTWKAIQHPAYNVNVPDNGNSIVQYPVKYDAQNDMGDWSSAAWYTPGYVDAKWESAIEKGGAGTAPWYNLEPNFTPLLINHGLEDYENNNTLNLPFISDGNTIECMLPFNKQITPYFEIESEAGKSIFITTDNRLNKISAEYTTKTGNQKFECLSWMNGHIVKYTFPAGVKVKALKYRWMSVGEMAGNFEASDSFYERLWWMGRNTLFVCARDNFMDCPDRERALWIGDVADQTGYLFYAMDNAGRQLLKKAILNTMNFSENKVIGALGPLRVRELPAQSLQFISQTVWPYYLNTGDTVTLEKTYPFIYDYLALWPMNPNGLPVYRKGQSPDSWDWVDWGVEGTADKEPIQHALYYSALVSAGKMAKILGESSDVEWYENRIASIKNSFDKVYWKNGLYSSDASKFQDDRANALAILSGLADSLKRKEIVKNVLVPNRYCSPHFEWMVEAAMCESGNYSEALNRMKLQYQSQVNTEGLTTLYENFPKGGSYNHAWNAPNTILSRYIAGIEPTDVGWSEYRICPNLVHFTSVKQTVPTVKGTIEMDINSNSDSFTIDLTSPDGTIAIVGIPTKNRDVKNVTVDGKSIWKNREFMANVAGINWSGQDSSFILFKVAPGTWKIVAEGKLDESSSEIQEQKPFNGTPAKIPGSFEAEDYDLGGEGKSYHDSDHYNQTGDYRNDGVDIAEGVIVYSNKGEWLEYTVDVESEGEYNMKIYYSSARPGGGAVMGVSLPDENVELINGFELPVTGSWNDYQEKTIGSFYWSKGTHVLRITVVERGFNLNKITFNKTETTSIMQLTDAKIKAFPNPSANGRFTLNKLCNWEIFALSGIKILEGTGQLINISHFTNGAYILQVENSFLKLLVEN